MENIRQAIERAKVGDAPAEEDDALNVSLSRRPVVSPTLTPPVERLKPRGRESELSKTQLQANRIIAHDIADPRAKAFDMLRTQILRTMDLKGWQVLAITKDTRRPTTVRIGRFWHGSDGVLLHSCCTSRRAY